MAVLIKEMEMPKTCDSCHLNYDCYMCGVNNKPLFGKNAPENFDSSAARLPTCPLEEITYIEVKNE